MSVVLHIHLEFCFYLDSKLNPVFIVQLVAVGNQFDLEFDVIAEFKAAAQI